MTFNRSSPADLSFVKRGDRYETYAGWTATIERINGFRVEGYVDTDYCRSPCVWRQDGVAEAGSNTLVDKIDTVSLPPERSFNAATWFSGLAAVLSAGVLVALVIAP